jgi:hypothetical protein
MGRLQRKDNRSPKAEQEQNIMTSQPYNPWKNTKPLSFKDNLIWWWEEITNRFVFCWNIMFRRKS